MAKKDVDDYFNQIYTDYKEMQDTLIDMEEAAQHQLVSPEQVDNIKMIVENMKTNYMRISYIMYLLNKPKTKKKQKMYDRMVKEPKVGSLQEVREENKSYINDIKSTLGD